MSLTIVIPTPVSCTTTTAFFAPSTPDTNTRTVTAPPKGVYFRALETRL